MRLHEKMRCLHILLQFIPTLQALGETIRHVSSQIFIRNGSARSRPAMSNPNGILSQKLCPCLNQGRTMNDILMRTAYWMVYFDLSKLNLA